MNIKVIKTETEYQEALERLEVIFDAKAGTKEGDELEVGAIGTSTEGLSRNYWL